MMLSRTLLAIFEGIAKPILLGSRTIIAQKIQELGLDLKGIEVINPSKSARLDEYVNAYYAMRARKGVTKFDALRDLKSNNVYGMMMVELDSGGQMPYTPREAAKIAHDWLAAHGVPMKA